MNNIAFKHYNLIYFLLLINTPIHASDFYISGTIGNSTQKQRNRDFTVNDHDLDSGLMASANTSFARHSKNSFRAGIAIGYQPKLQNDLPIRLELEVATRGNVNQESHRDNINFDLLIPNYRNNSITYNNKIATHSLLLNIYKDFDNFNKKIKPYLAAGVGISNNRLKHHSEYIIFGHKGAIAAVSNNYRFTYSIGTGIKYDINKIWNVALGYRYIDAGKATAKTSWTTSRFGIQNAALDADISTKIKYHDVQLSLIYNF